MTVAGTSVFIKRVALTERERKEPGQTRNLFGLPGFFQYGVGSAGFGVWRELAAHQRATEWVLTEQCESFPLLHHWRIAEGRAPEGRTVKGRTVKGGTLKGRTAQPRVAHLHETIDEAVAFWDGDEAVRGRLEAIGSATASLLLVLEFVGATQSEWLTARPEQIDRVGDQLLATVDFMSSQGMVHFDAHPRNVLVDRERVYVTDFGLALDAGFDLGADEANFLARHLDFDRQNAERFLDLWAPGRYEATARKLNDFYDRLVEGPKAAVSWVP
jgi:hypothetical protein